MTLNEIIQDIHALEEDILTFERKYGVLTETFYESYINGEEPEDDAWVLDWNDWAGAYEILQERREQCLTSISRRTSSIIASLRRSFPSPGPICPF